MGRFRELDGFGSGTVSERSGTVSEEKYGVFISYSHHWLRRKERGIGSGTVSEVGRFRKWGGLGRKCGAFINSRHWLRGKERGIGSGTVSERKFGRSAVILTPTP